jgi:hypothetical protein
MFYKHYQVNRVQFCVGGIFLNYLANPITPQANLFPAFPVFFDYSLSVLPKSSSF